jgi:hypothetical protein
MLDVQSSTLRSRILDLRGNLYTPFLGEERVLGSLPACLIDEERGLHIKSYLNGSEQVSDCRWGLICMIERSGGRACAE